MEAEGAVGAYLAGCVDDDGGYRFGQVVDVITWEVPA
jgi:hypothetical protein